MTTDWAAMPRWRGDPLPEPVEPGLPRLRQDERDLLWPFTRRAGLVELAARLSRGDRVMAGRCTPHCLR